MYFVCKIIDLKHFSVKSFPNQLANQETRSKYDPEGKFKLNSEISVYVNK